jgi:hypothetical protein
VGLEELTQDCIAPHVTYFGLVRLQRYGMIAHLTLGTQARLRYNPPLERRIQLHPSCPRMYLNSLLAQSGQKTVSCNELQVRRLKYLTGSGMSTNRALLKLSLLLPGYVCSVYMADPAQCF